MLVYLFIYIYILYLSIFRNVEKYNHNNYLVLWTVVVALVCGLRDMLGGYDSYIYGEVFDNTSDGIDRGLPFFSLAALDFNPTEPGYAIYNIVLGYVTGNRYIFLFITSIITFTCLYYHIKRYCKYPEFSFFILFCMWYFYTFTYLRQVLAACIAWFAIPYAIERKPMKFFLIVALAATFHNSAVLFGLLYFIANKRFTKNQMLTYIVLSLLVGLTPAGTILFGIMGGTMNEGKAAGALAHINSGRIEYVLEAGFFFALIYYKYNDIVKDKLSTCMLNVALLFMFVLTFFVRFTDGGRMSWYFLIGIAATISQISMKGFNTKLVKPVTVVVVSMLYFRILFAWGVLLSPYKTFLTDGIREKDFIWENYEYDHNYDKDKLYRPVLKVFKADE